MRGRGPLLLGGVSVLVSQVSLAELPPWAGPSSPRRDPPLRKEGNKAPSSCLLSFLLFLSRALSCCVVVVFTCRGRKKANKHETAAPANVSAAGSTSTWRGPLRSYLHPGVRGHEGA